MRLLLHSLAAGVLLLAGARFGLGQAPAAPPPGGMPELPPAAPPPATAQQLELCVAEMEKLHNEEAALQAAPQDDEQKKKIELLQKQVETLEKITKLLADELKKQTSVRHPGGALRPGGAAGPGAGQRRR